MATSTGKKARKRLGNRYAAKRSSRAAKQHRQFGTLPVSMEKGNAQEWVRQHSTLGEQEGE